MRLIHPIHRPPDDCPRDQADWTDHKVTVGSHPLIDAPILDDLQFIRQKVDAKLGRQHLGCWSEYDRRFGYGNTVAVLANSSYRDRRDVAMCGKLGYKGWFGCGNRLFCPRCYYNRRTRRLVAAFADSNIGNFDVQSWYLVLSVSTNPVESQRFLMKTYVREEHQVKALRRHTANHMPFSTTKEVFACRMIIEFFQEAIRKLTRGGILHGVLGGPEISVRFMPLAVMPHANYVVFLPEMTKEILRRIREYVRDKMRGCRKAEWAESLHGVYPDIAAYRLVSCDDRRRVLQYITKAVDIGGPYDDVRASCKGERSSMREINAQTNLFLTNVSLLFYKLARITRWGGCNGQSNCCIAAGHEPTISVDESLRRRRKSIKLSGPGLMFATFTKWAARLARRRPWSRYADWHLRQLSTPLPKPPAAQPPEVAG